MPYPPLPPGPDTRELREFWVNYIRDPGAAIRRLYERYGPVFRFRSPTGSYATGLVGPEAAHYVLSSHHGHFQSSGAFSYLDKVAPRSGLTLDGEEHDRVRRILMPALHKRRVERYLEFMVPITNRVLDQWPVDVPIEVTEQMRELTFQILMRALFDLELREESYRPILTAMKVTSTYLEVSPRQEKPTKLQFEEAKALIDRFVTGLVQDREADREDRGDVLSVLLHWTDEGGRKLESGFLYDQMWSLLFAGHDTSANTLAWTLYLMSLHPEKLHMARCDLEQGLGSAPRTTEQLEKVHYLDWVLKESLRLYPATPAIPRIARIPFEWQGYNIPAGDTVICYIFLTHRLPHIFANPDEFNPERWDPEHGEQHPPFSYAPFGVGPRLCPGMVMALLEMKVFLSMALTQFDFTPQPGQSITAYAEAPAMRPKPGIIMRVHPRLVPPNPN